MFKHLRIAVTALSLTACVLLIALSGFDFTGGSLAYHSAIKLGQRILILPYCVLALVTAAIAAFPWIRWSRRFSLRTLLIATTLVAVALGIIVAAR